MDDTHPVPFRIAIIGAGIAGLTLANALKINNPSIQLTIYESRLRFSEISAAVSLGPNAIRALSLMSPKLANCYESVAVTNCEPKRDVWYTIRDGEKGTILRDTKMMDEIKSSSASRSKFLEKLVELLHGDVVVNFGKRIIDVQEKRMIDEWDGEGVRLRFEDGSEAWADAVIGCDGIRSRCRRILLGDDDPCADALFSEKYAYRKVLSMKTAVASVGEEVLNRQMFLGRNGHVLTHPINNGYALNVVAFRDSKGASWKQRQWVVPSSKEALRKDFAGWHSDVTNILMLIEEPEKWGLFDTTPISTYSKGNFCILGDAAHACTPHLDAGAGSAIEDAYILSGLLAHQSVKSVSDVKHAFTAWNEIRRPRCEELISRSRMQGIMLDSTKDQRFELGVDGVLEDLENNQRWVWNIDLEKTMKQSIEVFERAKKEDVYPPVF